MSNENAISIAAQLYECRKTAKQLLGENYNSTMAEFQQLIKTQANASECNTLQAVINLSKGGSEMRKILLLSAYVEMKEPSIA